MNMIKCGAENIFKATDAATLDEDIDLILQRGEEKTLELNEKLTKFTGFNISLGAPVTQQAVPSIEEDIELSEETKRMMEEQAGGEHEDDVLGKRDRSAVDYDTNKYYRTVLNNNTVARHLRKPMRMPKLMDFQLYDIARISELCDKEAAYYNKCIVEKTTVDEAPSLSGLSDDEHLERQALLQAGFPSWRFVEYKAYLRGCERHGRNNHSKIAADMMTKSVEEVKAYGQVFWQHYRRVRDWQRLVKVCYMIDIHFRVFVLPFVLSIYIYIHVDCVCYI